MSISTVLWDDYKRLRDCSISHPDVAAGLAAAGSPTTEPDGGWRLGHTSSWARWGPEGDRLLPIVADTEEEFSELAPMTTSIVFLGLNWGGLHPPVDPVDWQNFHVSRRDSFLAGCFDRVMTSEGFSAAPYLSDVFKLIPTPTSTHLRRSIKSEENAGRDPIGRCVDLLRRELEMCTDMNDGRFPVLVGFGGDAYGWLSGLGKATGVDNRVSAMISELCGTAAHEVVCHMPHYSYQQISKKEFDARLTEVFIEARERFG